MEHVLFLHILHTINQCKTSSFSSILFFYFTTPSLDILPTKFFKIPQVRIQGFASFSYCYIPISSNSFSINSSNFLLSGKWSIYVETNSWLSIPDNAYSTICEPLSVQSKIPTGGLSPGSISFFL